MDLTQSQQTPVGGGHSSESFHNQYKMFVVNSGSLNTWHPHIYGHPPSNPTPFTIEDILSSVSKHNNNDNISSHRHGNTKDKHFQSEYQEVRDASLVYQVMRHGGSHVNGNNSLHHQSDVQDVETVTDLSMRKDRYSPIINVADEAQDLTVKGESRKRKSPIPCQDKSMSDGESDRNNVAHSAAKSETSDSKSDDGKEDGKSKKKKVPTATLR